jgi:hypothetical protein
MEPYEVHIFKQTNKRQQTMVCFDTKTDKTAHANAQKKTHWNYDTIFSMEIERKSNGL